MGDIKTELKLAKEAIKKKEYKEALKHCRVSADFQVIYKRQCYNNFTYICLFIYQFLVRNRSY